MSEENTKDPLIVESIQLQRMDGTVIPSTYLMLPLAYADYERLKILSDRYEMNSPETMAGIVLRSGLDQFVQNFGLRNENDKGYKNDQPGD
jgi:hypothetical protein